MKRLFQSGWGIIIVILVFLLIEFYAWLALKTAFQHTDKRIKIPIYVVYGLMTVLFYLAFFNFRKITALPPESFLSKYLFVFFLAIFIAKLFVALLLFIGDIYRLFAGLWSRVFTSTNIDESRPKGMPRSEFLSRSAWILGAFLMGSFFYGTRNKYNYKVRKIKIRFPNLPKAFKGFKIVQISDIHCGSFDSKEDVDKGMKMIMAQNADMILFTGDLVNDLHTEVLPYKEIFAQLSAPLGVFAVLGNHDYGDYHQWESAEAKAQNLENLKQDFKDMNWELLLNEHVVFDKKGDRLALIGVENWGAKGNFPKYGKMSEAVAGLDELDPGFKILMSHDPSHWDAEIRAKYPDIDLTLSGHTHGMQFGVRLPWMQWSPVQYMYKQWAGLYQEGQQYLYVNPGFGFIGYKGRVGILPEITVIELED